MNFIPNYFYHIYNRGNNSENIFELPENYNYFLKKFNEHLSDLVDVFSYCLLPNHFHFLIKIKDYEKNLPGFENREGLEQLQRNPVSQAFSNFFNGYTKAFNKQQDRRGSLFQKNFKSKNINREDYLVKIIYYLHINPVHHNISNNFENYKYSSYISIISNKPTKVSRDKVVDLFGDKEKFIEFHRMRYEEMNNISSYFLE